MSCAGPQPLAAKRRGRLPCKGNKGTRIVRETLASRECWQHGCCCSGKKAPEQGRGERLKLGGVGRQQEKGIRRFVLLNAFWNWGRHELDLESSSVVPLPALCFVAAPGRN